MDVVLGDVFSSGLVLGGWLDLMILRVSSTPGEALILRSVCP